MSRRVELDVQAAIDEALPPGLAEMLEAGGKVTAITDNGDGYGTIWVEIPVKEPRKSFVMSSGGE